MYLEKENTQYETGRERTLVNYRPVLFCAFFLCGGIVFYKSVQGGLSYGWLCLLPLIFFSLFLIRGKKEKRRAFFRCVSLLACFFVGMGAYALQESSYHKGGRYDGDYLVCGRVEENVLYADLCRLTLSDLEIDGNEEKGKLIAYLPYIYYEKIAVSDEVAIYGNVTRYDAEEDEYYAYAVEADIRFQMSGEDASVLGHEFRLFAAIREKMRKVLYDCMDDTTASVTLAVLTGNDVMMDDGLLDNVRRGGIAHIFAVSGLHVGALFAFALALLKTEGLKRLPKAIRLLFVALLLLFYGGICGYTSSVVRAIVMCLVLYASSLAGLATDAGETIGAAAILVLLLSPVSLFTAGFQLSFAACFGIAWLSTPISKRFLKPIPVHEDGETSPLTVWQKLKRDAISFFAVTVSAQIATAPIQLSAFGYLSGWSILTNCLFVPLISAVFPILLLLVAVSCIFPLSWAAALLYVPNVVWTVLLLVFETFDFSSFALTGVCLGGGAIVMYYLLCTFFTDKWRLPKRAKQALIALSLLVFAVSMYASNAPLL